MKRRKTLSSRLEADLRQSIYNPFDCKSKPPKWLELADGEVYLKSVLSKQVMFVFMMSVVSLLLAIMVLGMFFGDGKEILMPMTMALGSMSTVFTSFLGSKLHLTNQRLILELKRKPAGEIRLDEIKAIQITKQLVGGKVLIVPARKGAGGIEVNVVKPEQFAGEIQELSAGIGETGIEKHAPGGEYDERRI